ncbi:MAG TPA: short-chain dehydrogenase [Desulfobacteraceae bacterium]|nr:short-chain dehydrogenase [Desulfobacteraceae bacterium]
MVPKPKVVLITGCSSGIGRALSIALHERGCRVAATARTLADIEDLERMDMATHCLDVTDPDQGAQVIDAVIAQEGGIDILINNAGYALIGPAIELPRDELIRQLDTNVVAPMTLAAQAARTMKEKGSGMIVNIGSISGITPTPFSGAYCASKAALHALSDALRMELTGFGIHVMTVQPGAIRSDFGNAAGKTIARVLKDTSWYLPMKAAIEARANASQKDATPTDVFASALADHILSDEPDAVVRLGKMSAMIPMMKKWLPTKILDRILKKKFGLA